MCRELQRCSVVMFALMPSRVYRLKLHVHPGHVGHRGAAGFLSFTAHQLFDVETFLLWEKAGTTNHIFTVWDAFHTSVPGCHTGSLGVDVRLLTKCKFGHLSVAFISSGPFAPEILHDTRMQLIILLVSGFCSTLDLEQPTCPTWFQCQPVRSSHTHLSVDPRCRTWWGSLPEDDVFMAWPHS